MRILLLVRLSQALHAAQIADHILGLAKVHLLQQIAHLELHVLDQLADVGDVAPVVVDRQVRLDLPRHVARELHVAQRVGPRR